MGTICELSFLQCDGDAQANQDWSHYAKMQYLWRSGVC